MNHETRTVYSKGYRIWSADLCGCMYPDVVLTNDIRMIESQMEGFQSHRHISESNYYPLDGSSDTINTVPKVC